MLIVPAMVATDAIRRRYPSPRRHLVR